MAGRFADGGCRTPPAGFEKAAAQVEFDAAFFEIPEPDSSGWRGAA